jgi:hypothetical protein
MRSCALRIPTNYLLRLRADLPTGFCGSMSLKISFENLFMRVATARRIIYVKLSIAAAKIKEKEYLSRAAATENSRGQQTADPVERSATEGVLYVLRCAAMKDEIYKVGWTTGTAEDRAKSLSAATGVPTSFVVVDSWIHADAAALEKSVHAMLDPYRLNDVREFFRTRYDTIKKIVVSEIERSRPISN